MTTSVMTLQDYADLVTEVAENWEGDEAAVLIGDVHGNVSVSEKDGFSKYGSVAFAQEAFDDNGVWALGQESDHRFFGTMLLPLDTLSEEGQAQLGGEA